MFALQNNLYKKTPLQTTFSGNFLALMGSGTTPQRFTLRGALDCFLNFRFQTIRRRSAFQLRKVESWAHIVDGLLAALTCVGEVSPLFILAPCRQMLSHVKPKELIAPFFYSVMSGD